MARLSRLVIPGLVHHMVQRAHGSRPVFADDADRQSYLAALREAAAAQQVPVHGYALADGEVQLLATPPSAEALSRLLQTVGRRYVAAYNRRHGCSGTLWDGRFRCGVFGRGWRQLEHLALGEEALSQDGIRQALHGDTSFRRQRRRDAYALADGHPSTFDT